MLVPSPSPDSNTHNKPARTDSIPASGFPFFKKKKEKKALLCASVSIKMQIACKGEINSLT